MSTVKIYKITNTLNNEIFFGSTTSSLPVRLSKLKQESLNNLCNTPVHNHIRSIGKDHFQIALIETMSNDRDLINKRIKELEIENQTITVSVPPDRDAIGNLALLVSGCIEELKKIVNTLCDETVDLKRKNVELSNRVLLLESGTTALSHVDSEVHSQTHRWSEESQLSDRELVELFDETSADLVGDWQQKKSNKKNKKNKKKKRNATEYFDIDVEPIDFDSIAGVHRTSGNDIGADEINDMRRDYDGVLKKMRHLKNHEHDLENCEYLQELKRNLYMTCCVLESEYKLDENSKKVIDRIKKIVK
jgi:hypothetical protein